MLCTFWHCGVLIGEADLASNPQRRQQLAGTFSPTAYGLQIFPRLTGILSAARDLKSILEEKGLDPDDIAGDELEKLFDATPAGRKVIDIGRALSEVELRAPDGTRLEFASIAFTDLAELEALARELETDCADELAELPPEAPRYVVSATLRDNGRARMTRRLPPRPRR